MTAKECIKKLGAWEGYGVGTFELMQANEERPVPEFWVELFPKRKTGICAACGSRCKQVHDHSERWVRDLPVFGHPCLLHVHRRRLWCKRCGGPRLEHLSWLEPWARHTTRFAESVARWCKFATHKHIAAEYGIDRKTVKAIDKRYLERTLGPPDFSQVRVLAMDEFAIQKGHRYATVVLDPERKQVLWVGRGRDRQSVRAFFELLGPQHCRRIEAVAMDMTAAYEKEVLLHCPQAKIVYDQFHVVAKYGREVVDRVRVDEANRLREDKQARKVIKGSRWLLLRNKENLSTPEQRVRLTELLKSNHKLTVVYILKDDLKQLWQFQCPEAAQRFWLQWRRRALLSRIGPLKDFVRRLEPYIEGIIAHCQYPLHTSILEGINNKIKVIKRMAYGYRDDDYFFLKIRQAFPGNWT